MKDFVPDRGEIIWIDYNPQNGREMRDMHPMLVLSPKKFNDRTGIVIGLPMTTAEYNETNPFAVKFQGPQKKVSYILTHQPQSFDWRGRGAKPHPWKRIPPDIFISACDLLNQIILLSE
jgi:mRNA interferase MazF